MNRSGSVGVGKMLTDGGRGVAVGEKVDGGHLVTLIPGDGIGTEVIDAAVLAIEATGARILWERMEAGLKVFQSGDDSGVPQSTRDSIARSGVVFKGPLETPVGYGQKSANVTLRKLFETFGNIRPTRELPGIVTPFSGRGIDLVVVRENLEDLYASIEYMQTPTVAQGLKVISRLGSEKIIRLAFEVARSEGFTTLHCATKSNIMKITEALFKRTFEDVAKEYPDIQAKHIIIDNLAHQLAMRPEQFEVVVTTNLHGDIISDLAAGLVGGLGFAPSVNIGSQVAIFECVHGSAPDIAGQDKANPTAALLTGVMMLRHLGEMERAETLENALLFTLEQQKVRTGDVRSEGRVVGTRAFAEEICANLGKSPVKFARRSSAGKLVVPTLSGPKVGGSETVSRSDVGIDVYVEDSVRTPAELGGLLAECARSNGYRLALISNRGAVVYPPTGAMTDCVDWYRCRFIKLQSDGSAISNESIFALLQSISGVGRWMHVERLLELDGAAAYTKAQGEG